MTLDAIRKSILSEAEAKASAIESEATKEAHRIVKEAEDRAKDIIKNAEADAQREVERLRKEAEAGAETEANGIILEARGEAVERSLKRVMDGARSELSKNGMERIFKQGMKQFSEIAGDSDMTVKTGKKNAEILKGSKQKVEYESIDGFMFYTHDGKIALNATIESIAERETDQARKFVSAELFGAHGMGKVRAQAKKVKKAAGKKRNKKRG